ncbi:MarR family winged helix-turn-helix transcriptional regulator [Aeromicrobium sp.]|uniref:MarR family winged helix-turn-helix transcriptional regulator n=1 Tax=Aeromicrobium sp. TaxID=1871063 RepID=UPI003D69FFC6
MSDVGRRAWRAVMQATGTVKAAFDDDFRSQTDIDIQVYDVLLHVFESGNAGIQMSELAREIVLSKAGLTSLVDRLEKRSLVQRAPDPADRRAVRITLTKQGEKTFRTAARIHLAGIRQRVTQHLTDEEARIIADAFERVRLANSENPRRA